MHKEELKVLIYDNFIDAINPKATSLIEVYYFESCNYHDKDYKIMPLSMRSIESVKSDHYLSKHKAFVISNTVNDSFQEPFTH